MGGGKEKTATNQMINQDRARNQAEHNQFMGNVNTDWNQARQRNQDMYSTLYGGYKGFAEGQPGTGGGSPREGGGGGGGGGSIDTGGGDPRFAESETNYRNFIKDGGIDRTGFDAFQKHLTEIAESGGWSPEQRANIMGDVTKLRGMADDPTIANRMRGNGVFDEFARTGGYSDQDIANIRTRSNSVIPAYYAMAQRDAARRGAVQGGYGPGQSALMARMSRDQARGAASTALDAELGIKDRVNEGRQWGAGSLADAEGNYQGMRMGALTGASQTEGNMINSIAGNRTGAANAGASNESGMQGHIQQGKMFGTQGLSNMAENAAQRAMAASAASAAQGRWQAEFDREGQMFGLEGMRSLYGMEPGETNMYIGANLAGRGLNIDSQDQTYDARMRNNPQRDWLGTITGLAGAGAGLMTGAGALGFGSRMRTAT